MPFQPVGDEVSYLGIVLLLEQEVAVAVNVLLREIDDCGFASVRIIMLGKIAHWASTVCQNPVDWISSGPFII